MALGNINKTLEMDPIKRQEIAAEISANHGALAFMYAKNVYNNTRPMYLVPDRLKPDVKEVLAYVEEHNLSQVFE